MFSRIYQSNIHISILVYLIKSVYKSNTDVNSLFNEILLVANEVLMPKVVKIIAILLFYLYFDSLYHLNLIRFEVRFHVFTSLFTAVGNL